MVAEIGLNHNSDLNIAFDLMKKAKRAGFDCVKFQKRTLHLVYTDEELDVPRESPWGTTNREQKEGLEFGIEEYNSISEYANSLGIHWTASPWDENSIDFLTHFYDDIPYIKIASAGLTDKDLLIAASEMGKPMFLSTGMSDANVILSAVDVIERHGGDIGCIYHCCSNYPQKVEESNLMAINTLKTIFPDIPIGYSGHEKGIAISVMAAVMGAMSIERHITADRTMYGSDQAASLEPRGFNMLVRDIRDWENARGDGTLRIYDSERPIMKKLRRNITIFEADHESKGSVAV